MAHCLDIFVKRGKNNLSLYGFMFRTICCRRRGVTNEEIRSSVLNELGCDAEPLNIVDCGSCFMVMTNCNQSGNNTIVTISAYDGSIMSIDRIPR